MRLCLVTADPCRHSREYGPLETPVILGRSSQAAVRLNDQWVSRRHCEIDEIDGRVVLRDLGARHGTYVNGRPVSEAVLNIGDTIQIGLTVLRLIRCPAPTRLGWLRAKTRHARTAEAR
jgi:pSer/pThr/pTyr-binding forkhead associated (FHA) protein